MIFGWSMKPHSFIKKAAILTSAVFLFYTNVYGGMDWYRFVWFGMRSYMVVSVCMISINNLCSFIMVCRMYPQYLDNSEEICTSLFGGIVWYKFVTLAYVCMIRISNVCLFLMVCQNSSQRIDKTCGKSYYMFVS